MHIAIVLTVGIVFLAPADDGAKRAGCKIGGGGR